MRTGDAHGAATDLAGPDQPAPPGPRARERIRGRGDQRGLHVHEGEGFLEAVLALAIVFGGIWALAFRHQRGEEHGPARESAPAGIDDIEDLAGAVDRADSGRDPPPAGEPPEVPSAGGVEVGAGAAVKRER